MLYNVVLKEGAEKNLRFSFPNFKAFSPLQTHVSPENYFILTFVFREMHFGTHWR